MKDLNKETMRLVKSTTLTKQQIADGAGVGFQWISKYSQGRFKSPGVDRVQAVYNFLDAERDGDTWKIRGTNIS